jgi:hypothetical protein
MELRGLSVSFCYLVVVKQQSSGVTTQMGMRSWQRKLSLAVVKSRLAMLKTTS